MISKSWVWKPFAKKSYKIFSLPTVDLFLQYLQIKENHNKIYETVYNLFYLISYHDVLVYGCFCILLHLR